MWSFQAIACFILTLLCYQFAKKLYVKLPYLLFSPAIFTSIVLILFLALTHISYETYMLDSHWIVWMLGPATVAFAIPIFEYRQIIRMHIIAISLGVVIGMSAGMLSAFFLAQVFHFDTSTTYSLMARSISTPFAMELSTRVGGSVELVILFTMITGIVGMVCGDLILACTRLKSHFALGASLGNAAHGFGTTKAYLRDHEEGVIASLTMVIAGIFMVIFGPLFIKNIVLLFS